jgi:hypothetical protein
MPTRRDDIEWPQLGESFVMQLMRDGRNLER